jgi:hypothetical protein
MHFARFTPIKFFLIFSHLFHSLCIRISRLVREIGLTVPGVDRGNVRVEMDL